MHSPLEPRLLARFPWATFGRSETPSEFFQKIAEQRSRVDLFSPDIEFHLIADFSSPEHAGRTWESLLLQSFPRWRVWIPAPESARAALAIPADPRFVFLPVAEGPSWQAKNAALEKIDRGWCGVIGVGDVLSPSALYQMAWEIERRPNAPGFYSHAVRIAADGKPLDFFSKCAWSAITQAHFNYAGRFWVARRRALEPFLPLEARADEQVQLLQVARQGDLGLVPQFLYYGQATELWPEANEELARAVEPFLADASARLVRVRVRNRIVAAPRVRPRVTAIVCFRDRAELTLRAVRSLLACRGDVELDLILVDNDSQLDQRAQVAAFTSTFPVPTRLVSFPGPFHFNRMHNQIIREHTDAPVLLLLNNDVELKSVDLGAWAAWAGQKGIATVGLRLHFAHGGVQHAGIRTWFGGQSRLARVGNSHAQDSTAFETHAVFANTFAACMVNRAAFDALGGLREKDMVNGFGDVAFCLEAVKQGYTHLYLGGSEGVHAEGSSRGKYPYEYWEECGLEREYGGILQRMLREDLGVNRLPDSENAVWPLIVQALKARFRRRSRWLDPVKPSIKKWLAAWVPAEDKI